MDPQNIDNSELGQLGADGAPLYDAQPQGDQEPPDFEALLAERDQEISNLRGEISQTRSAQQQQSQQMAVQQVEAMWRQAEQTAWQNTEQMDPDTAKRYMANFYNERDKFTRDQATNALRSMGVNQWKGELQKRYQLTADEMTMLGDNPDQMEIHAQHLKRTRDQINQLRSENGTQHAANRGRQRLESGAGVPLSGGRSTGGPIPQEIERGSRQHLLALIEQGVI